MTDPTRPGTGAPDPSPQDEPAVGEAESTEPRPAPEDVAPVAHEAPVALEEPAAEAPADGAPPEPDPVAAEPEVEPQEAPEPEPEPVLIPGEQIEWQPVAHGEQIEWQPVVQSDETPGGEWVEPETPVAGNGARDAWTQDAPKAAASPPSSGTPIRPAQDDARSKTRRQVIILSVLTVVVIVIGVAGFILSRGATERGNEAAGTTPTTGTTGTTGPTIPASQLETYRDEQTGFTVKYPRAWQRLNIPVGDVRLLLVAGDNDAFNVRVLPIQTPATIDNIGNLKAVTDAIVFGDQSARLLQEQLVRLNGLLTYYYLYTFQDSVTNQQGVHAHYFVFEGQRMFSMVFQTVPAEEFPRQASVFDQVAESFTVEPRPGTTATPPTTVP